MKPYYQDDFATIYNGDALESLRCLPDESVQCCVTSPPYWGLRDYKAGTQEIGKEKTPQEFIARLIVIFREVRRVLADDGTLWVNIGDCYAQSGKGGNPPESEHQKQCTNRGSSSRAIKPPHGFKPKDLIGIPWMLAFALRDDGWYLRSDIIWAKPNTMPESVTDRPTRSHEYLFLLSKCQRYYYDHEAIKEPCSESTVQRLSQDIEKQHGSERANGGRKTNGTMKAVGDKQRGHSRRHNGFNDRWDKMKKSDQCSGMRTKRDVWTIPPACYAEAHFATYPPALVQPCILAGSRTGDTVLDPFAGSGTSGQVALELGRTTALIELNPDYCRMIENRLRNAQPGLPLIST